jgi:oligoribonuclease
VAESKPPETDRLVWMDLEMSGLDPEKNRILEVAILVTNGQLEIVAEGPELVIHQPAALLDGMDEWNTKHHGQSGLTARVRASTVTEADAEAQLVAFVAAHVPPRGAPLAGNSIHQDRIFVQRYFPTLAAHLHYRNVDVSTVKELVRRWYPQAYEARPTKKGTHRALDDIRESVEELRYYRKVCFLR